MLEPTAEAVETSKVQIEDMTLDQAQSELNKSLGIEPQVQPEPTPSEPVEPTEPVDTEPVEPEGNTDADEPVEPEPVETEPEPTPAEPIPPTDAEQLATMRTSYDKQAWELGELRKKSAQFDEFGALIRDPNVAIAILNAQSGVAIDQNTKQETE